MRFNTLDAFRGLCAVFVMIHHAKIDQTISNFNFFINSYIFVEFFFVLSGFVITHSISVKNVKFNEFVSSRVKRIFPLHTFVLIAYILLELVKFVFWQKGYSFNNVPFEGRTDLVNLLGNFLLLQVWLPIFDSSSYNTVSWSISAEFYTYIIFFFLSSFSTRFNLQNFYKPVFLLVIIYIVYYFNVNFSNGAFRCLYAFFVGSVVYEFYLLSKNSIKKLDSNFWNLIELSIVAFCVFFVSKMSNLNNELAHIVSPLVFAVAVYIFSFENGILSRFFRKEAFQKLGELSYSIYMIHVLVLSFITFGVMYVDRLVGHELFTTISGHRYINTGDQLINYVLLFGFIILTLSLSILSYKYVENFFSRK